MKSSHIMQENKGKYAQINASDLSFIHISEWLLFRIFITEMYIG